jgi:hypothetical protein
MKRSSDQSYPAFDPEHPRNLKNRFHLAVRQHLAKLPASSLDTLRIIVRVYANLAKLENDSLCTLQQLSVLFSSADSFFDFVNVCDESMVEKKITGKPYHSTGTLQANNNGTRPVRNLSWRSEMQANIPSGMATTDVPVYTKNAFREGNSCARKRYGTRRKSSALVLRVCCNPRHLQQLHSKGHVVAADGAWQLGTQHGGLDSWRGMSARLMERPKTLTKPRRSVVRAFAAFATLMLLPMFGRGALRLLT